MAFSTQLGEAQISITASTKELKKALGRAKRSVTTAVNQMKARLRSVGTAATLGVTAPLLLLAKKSVDAWDTQAKAIAQVEAGLKSTGGTVGRTSKELRKMARELQNITRFGDEEILAGVTAQLLTFTNITGKQFDRTQKAALDLATRLDGDLLSASIQLGKALNDPVANLSALSRSGIQFSKEQKEVIKSLVETNRLADAQNIILAELEKQYGGSAEAAAKAGAGPFKQLANAIGDVTEVFGKLISEALLPTVQRLQSFTSSIANLSPQLQKLIASFLAFAAAAGPLALLISALLSPIGLLSAAVVGLVTVWQNWQLIGQIVEDVFNVVKTWILDKLGPVLDATRNAIGAVTDAFSRLWKVVGGSAVTKAVINTVESGVTKVADVIRAPIKSATESVKGLYADMWDAVINNLTRPAAEEMETEFQNLEKSMINPMENATNRVTELFKGMKEGVTSAVDDITSALQDLTGNKLLDSFLNPVIQSAGGIFGNLIGGLFGGGVPTTGLANGGPINKPTLVGERGPEMFMPGQAGTIVSNRDMGGSTVINQNISLMPDVGQAFKQQLAQAMPLIRNAAISGVAESQARRGGGGRV